MLRYIILKIKLLLLPDISNLATENALNAKINEVKGKLPNSTNLATNASFNAKINEVKGEISNITNLVSTTALTAAECKIPDISDLVKKTDYNTKFSEIDNKYTDYDHSNKFITTPEFNKLTSEKFGVRLKQANLVNKSDIAKFVTKTDFDNEIRDVTLIKGLTKDSINKFSVLNGAKYFSLGIFQNSLVFTPTKKCI